MPPATSPLLWLLVLTGCGLLLPVQLGLVDVDVVRGTPLAAAVEGHLFICSLSASSTQLLLHVLYAAILQQFSFPRSIALVFGLFFVASNRVISFFQTDKAAALYLALWSLAKATGILSTFVFSIGDDSAADGDDVRGGHHKLPVSDGFKKLQTTKVTVGYSLSCLSLLCSFYSSFLPAAWGSWLTQARAVCLFGWIAVLLNTTYCVFRERRGALMSQVNPYLPCT